MSSSNPAGVPPAVILINPKYAHNVGAVLRACSCFGLKQLWWTGRRVTLDVPAGGRLPREERMKGYRDVEMLRSERPFDAFGPEATPVVIEVRSNSECLFDFEHPLNPVFVFGPEDGSVPKPMLHQCHRFVVIPTAHCLNLATAVTTVLYDWRLKRRLRGLDPVRPAGDYLNEHRGLADGSDVFVDVSAEGLGAGHQARARTR